STPPRVHHRVRGTSKSLHRARQTSRGGTPSSIACAAVRPPSSVSTWSTSIEVAGTVPNSPSTSSRNSESRTPHGNPGPRCAALPPHRRRGRRPLPPRRRPQAHVDRVHRALRAGAGAAHRRGEPLPVTQDRAHGVGEGVLAERAHSDAEPLPLRAAGQLPLV